MIEVSGLLKDGWSGRKGAGITEDRKREGGKWGGVASELISVNVHSFISPRR